MNVLNQMYDENSIPDRRHIVFASFAPLQSIKCVEIENNDNNGMIKRVSQLQQSNTAHTPDPVNDLITTK